MKKIKGAFKRIILFVLNPRFLLCFGIAWLITNGWSYILLGIGVFCKIKWMVSVASAYLAFLWLPISPEKIVTCALAIVLLKWIFPKDVKTLGVLRELLQKARSRMRRRRKKEKAEPPDAE